MIKINSNISTKNLFTIYLTTLVVIVEGIIGILFYSEEKNRVIDAHHQYLHKIELSYNEVLHKIDDFYFYKAKMFTLDSNIISAMESQNRELLHSITEKRWELLKQENLYLKVMHFHLPDGTSLLRMHRPNDYGDNIAETRVLLQDVHKNRVPIYGIEVGKFYTVYRVVIPVFNNSKKYIGALEFGIRADITLKQLKDIAGVDGFYLVKNIKNSNDFKNIDDFYLDEYKLLYSTDGANPLLKALKEDNNFFNFENHNHLFKANSKYYLLFNIDIRDYSGDDYIRHIIYKDVTVDIDRLNSLFIYMSVIIVLLTTISIVLIRYGYRALIEKITDLGNELQAIFDTTNEGIALIDKKTNFLFTNSSYSTITGYTSLELLNTSCRELTIPAHQSKIEAVMKRVLSGERVKNHIRSCIAKNGKVIDVDMSLSLMPNRKQILVSILDITEKVEQNRKLNEYVHIIDQNIIHISIDLNGYITTMTEALLKLFSINRLDDVKNRHITDFLIGDNNRSFEDIFIQAKRDNKWCGDIKAKGRNFKGEYWFDTTISPLYSRENKIIGYSIIQHNITDKKRIEDLSIRDPLTKLYNRRHYNSIIERELSQINRVERELSFAILDVDNFKQYNDTYGHQAGDYVLSKIGDVLIDSCNRSTDYPFRMGGEEFGLIFRDLNFKESLNFLEKIRDSIENLMIEHNGNESNSNYVTASFGFVTVKNITITESELYKEADNNLYTAKDSGRNRVVGTQSFNLLP